MPDTLIADTIDLSKPPEKKWAGSDYAGICLTLGDLHGNALKLIHTLMNYGVLHHISDQDYLQLYDIYYSSFEELSSQKLDTFLKILNKARVNPDKLIRLLGDEVADRGCNDYFTLKVLEKLVNNNVDVEIILSNHGVELVDAYLEERDYRPSFIIPQQTTSMTNMQKAIDKNLITRKEVDTIISQHLIPNLKAIGCQLDKKNKNLEVYTHAPVGLIKTQLLSASLNIYYNDKTANKLKKTIHKINKRIRKKLKNRAFVELHKNGSALNTFLWNRDTKRIYRPSNIKNHTIGYRHGHHKKGISSEVHVFNLDNTLGKAEIINGKFRFNIKGEQKVAINKREQFNVHRYFNSLIYKNYCRLTSDEFTSYMSILNDGIFDINTPLFNKDSLLGMAIREGRVDYAMALIENGADIACCSNGHIKTAYNLASFYGESRLVEWLDQRNRSSQSSTTMINQALEIDTYSHQPVEHTEKNKSESKCQNANIINPKKIDSICHSPSPLHNEI